MMRFPCPPAHDRLPYVPESATDIRNVTVRIQVGVWVRSVGFQYSEIIGKIVGKNIGNKGE